LALRDPSQRRTPDALRGAPAHEHVLLYAPTYNPEFSAEPALGIDWVPRLRSAFPRLCIVIKPHPVIPERSPAWMERWKRWASADALVRLAGDPSEDIYPYFPFADALLTDASSVMFYFLAMDKPILLVTNPDRARCVKYFDPEAPEWTWRDLGVEVTPATLSDAVRDALAHPEANAERRRFYRERVFGNLTDGKAAQHVGENILALLAPEEERTEATRLAWWAKASLAEREAEILELERERSRPLVQIIRDRARAFARSTFCGGARA
jgi:CDP-glycerol glycerophosphotransferase (TagB/SpsB family)